MIQFSKERFIIDIKDIFLFKNVHEDFVNDVKYDEKHYNSGDIIYDKYHYLHALGYITNGCITIEQNGVILKNSYAGDVFGAAILFNDTESYVSVIRAKTKCTVIFIEQNVIRELICSNTTVAMNYIAFLSERIHYLNTKIAAFTAGTAEERFAKYIVDFYNESKSTELNGIVYSRLASSLDIGRASLYRVIDDFIARGFIIKNNKSIIIKDINKINNIIHKEKKS